MLKFRNINIIFALLLITLVVLDVLGRASLVNYLLLILLYLLILFCGSYFIQLQFYMPVLCEGNGLEKQIAISFDDGPHPQHTPAILEILKDNEIKATFFCIGKQAEAYADLLGTIHQQGHIIGSHSYSHSFWFSLFSSPKMLQDLQQSHQVFKNELGIDVHWFRPPYGVTNPNLKKSVEQMCYTTIGWNARSMDTVAKNEAVLLQKLKRRLQPGSVFLFHDTMKITQNVLPQFLKYVQSEGYAIVPMDKLLNLHHYAD